MTTARDICTAAFNELLVTGVGETPTASDASDLLNALNRMIYAWPLDGVEPLHQGFALNDTFVFWVPPAALTGEVTDVVSYQGTWNASTNTPSVTTTTIATGSVFKVATAGTTQLGSVLSWAVNEFAVYTGSTWLKGESSRPFEQAVISMLAVQGSSIFSVKPGDATVMNAQNGFRQLQSKFIKPFAASFDPALTRTPSRRWPATSANLGPDAPSAPTSTGTWVGI
jgi:hypothetical protein